MDLLSHALVGGLIASVGLHKEYGVVASATMIAANLLPDIDGVLAIAGPQYFFQYHRGPLFHSVGGALLLSSGLTAIVSWATPFKHPWLMFGISFVGVMLHLLSDLLVPWEIPLFWPLSPQTFSLDLISVFDPFLLVILGVGFFAANHWSERGLLLFALTAFVVAGYLGYRVYSRERALQLVRKNTASNSIAGLPHGFSLTDWDVIAQDDEKYTSHIVDSLRGEVRKSLVIRSVRDERVLAAESQSALAQAFLRRARFPVTFVSNQGNPVTIEWRDIHLMLSGGGIRGVKVVLDQQGKIVEERFELNVRN